MVHRPRREGGAADGQVFDRRVERVGVTDLASLADQQGFSGAEYHHFAIRLHLLGSARTIRVYSSTAGFWCDADHLGGVIMWAMLTSASPMLAPPKCSSMSFPAVVGTTNGCRCTVGTLTNSSDQHS